MLSASLSLDQVHLTNMSSKDSLEKKLPQTKRDFLWFSLSWSIISALLVCVTMFLTFFLPYLLSQSSTKSVSRQITALPSITESDDSLTAAGFMIHAPLSVGNLKRIVNEENADTYWSADGNNVRITLGGETRGYFASLDYNTITIMSSNLNQTDELNMVATYNITLNQADQPFSFAYKGQTGYSYRDDPNNPNVTTIFWRTGLISNRDDSNIRIFDLQNNKVNIISVGSNVTISTSDNFTTLNELGQMVADFTGNMTMFCNPANGSSLGLAQKGITPIEEGFATYQTGIHQQFKTV